VKRRVAFHGELKRAVGCCDTVPHVRAKYTSEAWVEPGEIDYTGSKPNRYNTVMITGQVYKIFLSG